MYQIEIRNRVQKEIYDDETGEATPREPSVIEQEEQSLIQAEKDKIQARVDTYKQAQEHQKIHGGAGPSADFVTMKIVNEHNGQFEVVFKEKN